MIDILSNLYGERIIEIQTHLQLPGDEYMVYIFGMNDSPVVVGHGKKIRSKLSDKSWPLILNKDSKLKITTSHE